jgi:hypothetical protein
VDESKDIKFASYNENNVLKRKWESKDGYKRGNQIVLPKLLKAVLELATISITILLNGSLMIGVFTIGILTLSLFDVL